MKLNIKPEIICTPVREQRLIKTLPTIKPKTSKALLLDPVTPNYGIVRVDKSSDSGSTVITINHSGSTVYESQQLEISKSEIEDFGVGAKPSKFYPENLTLLDMIKAIAEKTIKLPGTSFWTETELKFLHDVCGIKLKD